MLNVTWTPNPLQQNFSCSGPHSDKDKVYSYILDDGFKGGLTFLCVVNSIASLPTFCLNAIIIIAFGSQKKARTTANRLLFSICLADLFVGVLVEPIFAAQLSYIAQGDHKCGLSNFHVYLVPVLIVVTMVTHMVISLERYFAVHYPQHYNKVFNKRYITWLMILIWAVCLSCFIIPFLTGNPILGTRIIVTLILLSLALCAFCYISIYQDHKWKNGRPKAKIQGPYIIREIKPSNRSVSEMDDLNENVRVSSFYFKLFGCMVVAYVLNLTKNALNSYGVFSENTQHFIHFTFDTILFLNALANPILMLLFSEEVSTAVSTLI